MIPDLQGGDGKARKKYFTDEAHRKAFSLKDKPLAMEFSNGLIGASGNPSDRGVASAYLGGRLQHPLDQLPTTVQPSDPPYSILGWSARHLRLSKEGNTRQGRVILSGIRDRR